MAIQNILLKDILGMEEAHNQAEKHHSMGEEAVWKGKQRGLQDDAKWSGED